MTDKELERNKKEVCSKPYYETINDEVVYSKEYTILACISMINSILAYGYNDNAKYVLDREINSYHNYLEKYINALGYDKVLSLIQEQINDIDHVNYRVYEDGEGCTYNSITWIR